MPILILHLGPRCSIMCRGSLCLQCSHLCPLREFFLSPYVWNLGASDLLRTSPPANLT